MPAEKPQGQPAYPAAEPENAVRRPVTPGEGSERSSAPVPPAHGEPPDTTPPPQEADGAEEPPRRRSTKVLASVLVVLLLAAGGVLAVPDVSNRLGLPWAPNIPQGAPPDPREAALALEEAAGTGAGPTPSGVAGALDSVATDPALGKLTGSVVDPATGTRLWKREPSRLRTPASTTKLFTAAAALLELDHDMRLPTRVVQGSEPGTVVVVAGGDVTLSSLPRGEESIFSGAAHLDDLVDQVREATGGDISRVKLDLSAFTGPGTSPSWESEDVPSTYMVEVRPVMLDGGRTDPKNRHSIGVKDPAQHFGKVLAKRLGAESVGEATAPQGAKVLGEVRSAPVDELVRQSLVHSDNLLAEVLARRVAIAEGEKPSFAGAAKATRAVLSRHGIDVSDIELNDGSGLSPKNKTSAATLTRLLARATAPDERDDATASLRPMLVGLPVAGASGTLAVRYDEGSSVAGRGWVRAKTGSLPGENGVHTLAGMVLTSDGRVLVFALMAKNSDTKAARAALDRITTRLRACGCR